VDNIVYVMISLRKIIGYYVLKFDSVMFVKNLIFSPSRRT